MEQKTISANFILCEEGQAISQSIIATADNRPETLLDADRINSTSCIAGVMAIYRTIFSPSGYEQQL